MNLRRVLLKLSRESLGIARLMSKHRAREVISCKRFFSGMSKMKRLAPK
jgi:hypothetical protein